MVKLLPPLAGTKTFARAFVSLVLLELVALCGEWLVHQVEYVIVYGARFDQVMQTTPHRYYMVTAGWLLASVGVTLLSACLLILHVRHRATYLLQSRLPGRMRRLVRPVSLGLSWRGVLVTALLLMACQVTVYTAQENLEWLGAGMGAPGLSVLIGPSHGTVLPLHALASLCGSVLLWTLSALCRRSEQVLDAVRALARRCAGEPGMCGRFTSAENRIPHRRLLLGARGLRAPPARA